MTISTKTRPAQNVIEMNDFRAESRQTREPTLAAVARVLDSGSYILGPEVEAFERKWARLCGVAHAIGVGNGMDAIEIALRSLDIGPGDEVVTTPTTAFATVLAIIRAGAIPVLADIDPDTALLSLDSARRCITKSTKAIVLVHLYGQLRDLAAWQQLCVEHGIELIEDCAQAHGARVDEKVAGSFGRAGAYSFYPTKNLGAIGDAGALVTNDQPFAERAARLRNYGQSIRYHHPEIGLNSRLDELQAAILSVRLAYLEEWTRKRRTVATSYFQGIDNPAIRLLARPATQDAHVYHLFVICCYERDALQAHLKTTGVQTLIHYPVPVHHQEPCRTARRDPSGLANSERHAAQCLSVPCHPQLSADDVQRVIETLNAFRPN
jgi:dTDP-4-amino-4,6-dideoxygalactose transaminase